MGLIQTGCFPKGSDSTWLLPNGDLIQLGGFAKGYDSAWWLPNGSDSTW